MGPHDKWMQMFLVLIVIVQTTSVHQLIKEWIRSSMPIAYTFINHEKEQNTIMLIHYITCTYLLIGLGSYNKVLESRWVKQSRCLSHGSKGWKSELQVSPALICSKEFLLSLQTAVLSLSFAQSSWMHVSWCLSAKALTLLDQGVPK